MFKSTYFIESFGRKRVTSRDEFLSLTRDSQFKRAQTVNLHHLTLLRKNAEFFKAFDQADRLTADGWPIVLTLRLAGLSVDRVTGSDLVGDIVEGSSFEGQRLGLLGAAEHVGDTFALLTTRAGAALVFREHGLRTDWDLDSISESIERLEVDLLLVAVSPPWGDVIAAQIAANGSAKTVIAVGGALDMVAGSKRKAPSTASALGFEWLYRMAQDPKHLLRRYLVECGWTFVRFLIPLWLRLLVRRGTLQASLRESP